MTTLSSIQQAILEFDQQIEIKAPPADVFEGMLRRLSSEHEGENGSKLPLEIERRPGGRWFRNLGKDTGHLWGFVQSYRPPSLLEMFGPMFMSYPVAGHLIIRFEATSTGTLLRFRYSAFGLLQEDHRIGIQTGFESMLSDVQNSLQE